MLKRQRKARVERRQMTIEERTEKYQWICLNCVKKGNQVKVFLASSACYKCSYAPWNWDEVQHTDNYDQRESDRTVAEMKGRTKGRAGVKQRGAAAQGASHDWYSQIPRSLQTWAREEEKAQRQQ